jgi:hypothetical protein
MLTTLFLRFMDTVFPGLREIIDVCRYQKSQTPSKSWKQYLKTMVQETALMRLWLNHVQLVLLTFVLPGILVLLGPAAMDLMAGHTRGPAGSNLWLCGVSLFLIYCWTDYYRKSRRNTKDYLRLSGLENDLGFEVFKTARRTRRQLMKDIPRANPPTRKPRL